MARELEEQLWVCWLSGVGANRRCLLRLDKLLSKGSGLRHRSSAWRGGLEFWAWVEGSGEWNCCGKFADCCSLGDATWKAGNIWFSAHSNGWLRRETALRSRFLIPKGCHTFLICHVSCSFSRQFAGPGSDQNPLRI